MLKYKNGDNPLPAIARTESQIPKGYRWLYQSNTMDVTTKEPIDFHLKPTIQDSEVRDNRKLPSCYLRTNSAQNYYTLQENAICEL